MMLASNNGVGMNIGFPDVCLTPAAPVPIPVPYPNLAMNVMAVPFSPNIFIGFMPSVTMASKIPMTSGDEGGVAHPLFKQMGQYTMGNPTILVNCVPAINMLCPTTGNMFNNPIGAALVPSVTTTFYTDSMAQAMSERTDREDKATPPLNALDAAMFEVLTAISRGGQGTSPDVEARHLGQGAVAVRVRRFSAVTATHVYAALQKLGSVDAEEMVFDVRANPGGDVDGCLALLDDLLPRGSVMVCREDDDGDCILIRARQPQTYAARLTVVVDANSASAAEIFAAALQAHGRARIVGERTAGKSTAQGIARVTEHQTSDKLEAVYTSAARYARHDGVPIHDVGVVPDSQLEASLFSQLID